MSRPTLERTDLSPIQASCTPSEAVRQLGASNGHRGRGGRPFDLGKDRFWDFVGKMCVEEMQTSTDGGEA